MPDTIAAVATAPAAAAIGILRLSGPEAIAVLERVFTPENGAAMGERPDRLLVYGALRDARGRVIDRCLATVSRGPRSYTGEDTAEVQCHGSPAALALGLEAMFAAGARQALAGEFTRRALLNGRLDLTRTEAVADLIHAESAGAVYQAAGQLGGALSRVLEGIYDRLTDLMAHFHAVLDYPDEDIEPLEAAEMAGTLEDVRGELARLGATYHRGRALTEGVPCAIVGRPNAGKSTLFNALVGYERAIVTPIPGTTRDTVEETVTLGEVRLRLIDTAGLRESGDAVERLGVERSRRAMERAELTLVLAGGDGPWLSEDEALLRAALAHGKTILVRTKGDLPACSEGWADVLARAPVPAVTVCARTGEGLDELERAAAELFPEPAGFEAGQLLTNLRQAQAAARAEQAAARAAAALTAGVTPDAVLTDVEEALSALGELSGRTVREDIVARVFERFCVGK